MFTLVHKKVPAKKKVPGSPAARLPHILHPWLKVDVDASNEHTFSFVGLIFSRAFSYYLATQNFRQEIENELSM